MSGTLCIQSYSGDIVPVSGMEKRRVSEAMGLGLEALNAALACAEALGGSLEQG